MKAAQDQKQAITNSHNDGVISLNVSDSSGVGGLIGKSYGILNVENSYNSANIQNLKNIDSTKNVYILLGGLIGSLSGGSSIIKNSYNIGNVSGGNDVGGIVAYCNSIKLIIDRCYNNGSIYGKELGSGWDSFIGGLAGYILNSESYIINSYNAYKTDNNTEGKIQSDGYYAGGLVGMYTYFEGSKSKQIILNSYNLGTVISVKSYAGIIGISQGEAILNNIYNVGTSSGKDSNFTFGIGYFENSLTSTVSNSYYNNAYRGSNISVGEGRTLDNMKSVEFINKLNSTVDELNNKKLETIDINLKGYTLSKWKQGTNGYPVFDYQS